MHLGDLIPQGLQANYSVSVSPLPEHVRHLAVRANHAVLPTAARPFINGVTASRKRAGSGIPSPIN